MIVSLDVARRTRSAALHPVVTAAVVLLVTLAVAGGVVGGLLDGVGLGTTRPAGALGPDARLEPSRPVERVLIVSIPHVGWEGLDAADAPNLKRLLARSAVASMTARSGGGGFVSGYATLGAGKRSKGTATASDGMGFGVDDRFGDDTAGDAFARRTGIRRDRGLVHLGIVPLVDVNDDQAGGSSIGALGTALREAGYRTVVIGNSDGSAPDDALDRYRRYLVAGLMSERGVVDGGDVSRRLLEPDPSAPFGLRLDNDAVLDVFRAEWTDRTVALVEGSDLVRAVASRPPALAAQDAKSYAQALRRTDELVGRLLDEVDEERDAVVVVSPYGSRTTRGMTVVGVRAPGVEPGLMSSSSTRRDGFVLLADVAPSVLRLLDVARPSSMNGRPFTVGGAWSSHDARVEHLIDEARAALFRDRVLTPTTILATVMAALVAIGAVVMWELRRPGPWCWFARFGSSWLLGLVPAVYLARLVPFHDAGVPPYYLFLAGVAFVLALVYELAGAGDPTRPTLLGVAVLVALLAVDLVTGANLQLSTAFGYTPSIGVRFAGVGNVAYAFLGASTIFLAALVAHRVGGRRGAWVAVVVMFAALVVDAAPMFGGDVGGALSLTVAYLVTALLLFGSRIRWHTVVWLALAAIGALALATLADLARPARDRTHLGRLVTNARERGASEIVDVVLRKLNRNLDTWTTSAWRSMLVIGVLFALYLWWRRRAQVRGLVADVPELRAALVGFTVLTVLGYAVNDSGVAIPAVTLYVLVAAMTGMLVRRREPDQEPATTTESTDSVLVATPSH